ncbi:hypothetical protein D9M72_526960 [compost metagenome]
MHEQLRDARSQFARRDRAALLVPGEGPDDHAEQQHRVGTAWRTRGHQLGIDLVQHAHQQVHDAFLELSHFTTLRVGQELDVVHQHQVFVARVGPSRNEGLDIPVETLFGR